MGDGIAEAHWVSIRCLEHEGVEGRCVSSMEFSIKVEIVGI